MVESDNEQPTRKLKLAYPPTPAPQTGSPTRMVVFGLAMMVALGGVLLEMGIGSRFIFFHSADQKAGA